MQHVAGTMQKIDSSARRVGVILDAVKRHRLPDQHPRAERRRRGGARGRPGPRLSRSWPGGAHLAQSKRRGRQEIKALIGESIANVEAGQQLVEVAGGKRWPRW
jgi:methyl-accepting chemotaxis protein